VVRPAIAAGVRATANSRVDAASVVASWVRADRSVAIRIWKGSSDWLSEIFSTAGSSRPSIARASARMTASTFFACFPGAAGSGFNAPSPDGQSPIGLTPPA
jgi:hypothetical protein